MLITVERRIASFQAEPGASFRRGTDVFMKTNTNPIDVENERWHPKLSPGSRVPLQWPGFAIQDPADLSSCPRGRALQIEKHFPGSDVPA